MRAVLLAAVLYFSGFEGGYPPPNPSNSGDTQLLQGCATYTTSVIAPFAPRSGAWTLAQTCGSALATSMAHVSTNTIACRAWVWPQNVVSNTSYLWGYAHSGAATVPVYKIGVQGGFMQLQIIADFGSTITGTHALTAQQWNRLDFVYDKAAGGIAQVYVNTVLDINTTHPNDQNTIITVGSAGAAAPNHYSFDDVLCQDGLALAPDGHVIVRQGVVGSPIDNAWTLTSCATIDLCWSNTPFTTASHAASGSTTSAIAQTMVVHPFSTIQTGHGTETISSGYTINAVQISVTLKTSSTSNGGNTIALRHYVNGAGPTDQNLTITTADDMYHGTIFTDTPANLDLYEIGANKPVTTAALTQTIEDMWLMVDYLAPAAPATGVKHKVTQ